MVCFRHIIVSNLHKGDNTDYYYYYAEGVVTKNFLKYLENIDLTKNILRVRPKAVIKQTCLIQGLSGKIPAN
jgi:hypothetical protein